MCVLFIFLFMDIFNHSLLYSFGCSKDMENNKTEREREEMIIYCFDLFLVTFYLFIWLREDKLRERDI